VESLVFLFSTAFLIGLSGAMMPGPVLVATINRSARMGFKAGLLVVIGYAAIELVLIAAILLGLGSLLERQEVIQPILLGGGAMLVFLGSTIMNDVRTGKASLPSGPTEADAEHGDSIFTPVIEGVITSVSNPYWSIWWATIGLAYIAMAKDLGPLGLPAFYSGHILSDLAWFSLVAAGVAVGTRHMNDVVYRLVLGGCSVFLVALGLVFAVDGLSGILQML
jgi:threonine/homoserine/homoserine lactone efflux protein